MDSKRKGKRITSTAKFIEQDKKVAFNKIAKKKDKIINKLMVECDLFLYSFY